jgi:hypothetical protein
MIEPSFKAIVFASQFSHWQTEETLVLDLGIVSKFKSADKLTVSWGRDLSFLPRFENGRFGRLCWVCWDPHRGRWIGGHGEHLRVEGETSEALGSTIGAWEEDQMTLGETLAAKSKLDIDNVEIATAYRWGAFVVSHDQSPDLWRSKIHWNIPWGDDPGPEPENDYDQGYADAIEDAIRSLKTFR